MRALLILAALVALVGCGASAPAAGAVRDRLNGTWANDVATYTFDVAAGTMTRVALGLTEEKPFTVESESGNSVTIRTDGDPITITFESDGTISMAQTGKIPVTLTKQ